MRRGRKGGEGKKKDEGRRSTRRKTKRKLTCISEDSFATFNPSSNSLIGSNTSANPSSPFQSSANLTTNFHAVASKSTLLCSDSSSSSSSDGRSGVRGLSVLDDEVFEVRILRGAHRSASKSVKGVDPGREAEVVKELGERRRMARERKLVISGMNRLERDSY